MTVLHYIGANDDRGGIVSVVRGLAGAGLFACELGVNRGAVQRRVPPLPAREFSPLAGEQLGLATWWRARAVAAEVRAWLREDASRIFHGHSRAGLAVALRLSAQGESRVVASVHCYGKQRWFYRWAACKLGMRLYWLSPAMKRYYGIEGADTWQQCVPGCVPAAVVSVAARMRRADGVVRLGGAGMLVSWKRWHLVLEALANLPESVRSRVRFDHIGATDDSGESRRYAEALRVQTAALGLADIVAWRGEQPDAAALLSDSDALVVASQREPLSVAMLEALRAGVPVLAARSGGNVDVIDAPRNGWFFQGEAADLARSIAMLVETDALANVAVRPGDVARFEAPVVAAQWAKIYARLG